MEAAGHVGAADNLQHGRVIAHAPGAQALTQVAVQIYFHHLVVSIVGGAARQ
ncbi:hypothetical protein D3C85_1926330 [compost metagenome]